MKEKYKTSGLDNFEIAALVATRMKQPWLRQNAQQINEILKYKSGTNEQNFTHQGEDGNRDIKKNRFAP